MVELLRQRFRFVFPTAKHEPLNSLRKPVDTELLQEIVDTIFIDESIDGCSLIADRSNSIIKIGDTEIMEWCEHVGFKSGLQSDFVRNVEIKEAKDVP